MIKTVTNVRWKTLLVQGLAFQLASTPDNEASDHRHVRSTPRGAVQSVMPRDTRTRGRRDRDPGTSRRFRSQAGRSGTRPYLPQPPAARCPCHAVWRSIQACTSRSLHRRCLPIRYACNPHSRHLSRTVRSGTASIAATSRADSIRLEPPRVPVRGLAAAGRPGLKGRGSALRGAPQPRGLQCAQVSPRRHGKHGHPALLPAGLLRDLPVSRHPPGHR
jgi:hypothetical protein